MMPRKGLCSDCHHEPLRVFAPLPCSYFLPQLCDLLRVVLLGKEEPSAIGGSASGELHELSSCSNALLACLPVEGEELVDGLLLRHKRRTEVAPLRVSPYHGCVPSA